MIFLLHDLDHMTVLLSLVIESVAIRFVDQSGVGGGI
jgi:hypothetical protein